MYLSPKHDASEKREEETFKHSKQSENERQWTGDEGIATLEVLANTAEEKQTDHTQAKDGHAHDVKLKEYNNNYSQHTIRVLVYTASTHCEQDKKFLVVFSNTVVDPWAVVVHPLYAMFTSTTMVSSVWLDATASLTEPNLLPFLTSLKHLLF